jgi:hypothetical protein
LLREGKVSKTAERRRKLLLLESNSSGRFRQASRSFVPLSVSVAVVLALFRDVFELEAGGKSKNEEEGSARQAAQWETTGRIGRRAFNHCLCLHIRATRTAIERPSFRPFASSSSLCFVFSRLKQLKHQSCLLVVRLQPSTSDPHLHLMRCERETLIERRSSNKGSGSVNKGVEGGGNASAGWRDG